MAELLLFKFDHAAMGDKWIAPWQINMLPKPFDVITCQEDGHSWGSEDLANPWFRIVVWPGIAAGDLDYLLETVIDDATRVTRLFRARNLSGLLQMSSAFAEWWENDLRILTKFSLPVGLSMAAIAVNGRFVHGLNS